MPRPRKTEETASPQENSRESEIAMLTKALTEAMRQNQGPVKKTAFNKPHGGPWEPKDGTPKLRLKRRTYHHSMLIGEPSEPSNRLSNEEIALLNKLKPGKYLNNFVTVSRLRNKGIDIDYPVRTNAQRLKLQSDFGIRSFQELLTRIIDEGNRPKPAQIEDED